MDEDRIEAFREGDLELEDLTDPELEFVRKQFVELALERMHALAGRVIMGQHQTLQ
jgi:hypothetical protein